MLIEHTQKEIITGNKFVYETIFQITRAASCYHSITTTHPRTQRIMSFASVIKPVCGSCCLIGAGLCARHCERKLTICFTLLAPGASELGQAFLPKICTLQQRQPPPHLTPRLLLPRQALAPAGVSPDTKPKSQRGALRLRPAQLILSIPPYRVS